jgi:hypothetical protein
VPHIGGRRSLTTLPSDWGDVLVDAVKQVLEIEGFEQTIIGLQGAGESGCVHYRTEDDHGRWVVGEGSIHL